MKIFQTPGIQDLEENVTPVTNFRRLKRTELNNLYIFVAYATYLPNQVKWEMFPHDVGC